jgi:hypothetical protein
MTFHAFGPGGADNLIIFHMATCAVEFGFQHNIGFCYTYIIGPARVEIGLKLVTIAAFRFPVMAVHTIVFGDNKLAVSSLVGMAFTAFHSGIYYVSAMAKLHFEHVYVSFLDPGMTVGALGRHEF